MSNFSSGAMFVFSSPVRGEFNSLSKPHISHARASISPNNRRSQHKPKIKGMTTVMPLILVDPKGFEPSVSALRTRRFPS